MDDHGLLPGLVATFAIGLVSVVALARVRVPAIVALMLSGVVAGPDGLAVIRTSEQVETLAEIGIVLLLFTVGLDFSLAAIRRSWRAIVVGGTLQMIGTAAVVALLLVMLTATPRNLSIFVGLFVALSSTAIVLKGLAERNELSTPYGRLMVGVLLLQDLAIVVLLLLVPMLSGAMPFSAVGVAIGKAILAIAAIAGVARLVLPVLLRVVTASGRHEAFPLAILVASVGTAWASSLLGLSMAIGAFLAGLMLAESEFSHQAYAEIRGIRDILSALFFISVGMLLDLEFMSRQWLAVGGAALAIVVVKAAIAAGALLAVGTPLRIAAAAAIGLAQVGEFSFILGRAGREAGLLPEALWQLLLGASIVAMAATPSLLAAAPAIAARLRPRARRAGDEAHTGVVQESGHVIILGFGVGGQVVARALKNLQVPYVVLELNGSTVRRSRLEGERIVYGDATSPESLRALRIEHAAAVVSVLSDPDAAVRMVKAARSLAPTVTIVVRTRYRLEADRLRRLGAVAVAEELEASLELLAQLLARLHVPGNVIETLLDVFRRESITMRPVRVHQQRFDTLPDAIQRMPIATHRMEPDDWAVGRSLADIGLRAATGASILAIQSGMHYSMAPAADQQIKAGDVLYLTGDDSDVVLARELLRRGA